MADDLLLQGLEGLRQDTNDAWHAFLCLFCRDCSKEGPLKSLDLLHARLSLVTKQITSISHLPSVLCDLETSRSNLHHPTDTFSDRPIRCPPTQVGMEYGGKTTVTETFVKSEFPEKSQSRLGDSSVLLKQDLVYLGLGLTSGDEKLDLVQKPLQNPANTSSSYPIKIVKGIAETGAQKRARADSDGRMRDEKSGETEKRSRLTASKSPVSREKIVLPSRISNTENISSKNEIIKYQRHFEMEEILEMSDSRMEKKAVHLVDHRFGSFEQLPNSPDRKGTEGQQRTVTVEDNRWQDPKHWYNLNKLLLDGGLSQ